MKLQVSQDPVPLVDASTTPQVRFSKAVVPPSALSYIEQALSSGLLCGDNAFTKRCQAWFDAHVRAAKTLLTTSGTHSLELAALLLDIRPGDEVIAPSFTFPTTASAFVLRGARVKFVDVNPGTMNIDESLLEAAITPRTRAIIPVHYAGVACEMDTIIQIARSHDVKVVEDAAQGICSTYDGRPLGSIGDLGIYSFHETKNISCGEGGALMVNDPNFALRAEVLREKGTNRAQFFRGEIDKYSWIDIGSSFLLSDLNAALLYSQLEMADRITSSRRRIWSFYYTALTDIATAGHIELPVIPEKARGHNAHIFFFKVRDLDTRGRLLRLLKGNGIHATFHYVPLHSSKIGSEVGDFVGEDTYTTRESERLVRIPLYHGMDIEREGAYVVDKIHAFFAQEGRRSRTLQLRTV